MYPNPDMILKILDLSSDKLAIQPLDITFLFSKCLFLLIVLTSLSCTVFCQRAPSVPESLLVATTANKGPRLACHNQWHVRRLFDMYGCDEVQIKKRLSSGRQCTSTDADKFKSLTLALVTLVKQCFGHVKSSWCKVLFCVFLFIYLFFWCQICYNSNSHTD